MRFTFQHFSIATWLTILLAGAGCGQRATVERTYTEGEDPSGEYTESYGTSIGLESGPQNDLNRAKALARDGNFDLAIELFSAVYRSESVEEEIRAEALLRWAESEGNLLNPERNLDRAIQRLELFQEQFPRSVHLDEAQRSLERLRRFRSSQESGR